MIEEQATITEREGDYAWLEARKQSACGGCELKSGCGTSVLSKWLSPRLNRMRALNEIEAEIGDNVIVGLQEGALLRGAFMVYLFPLVAMLAAALVAKLLGGGGVPDGWVILAGVGGLMGASLFLRRYHRRIQRDNRYQPVILRKAPLVEPVPVNIDTSSLKGF